MTTYNYTVSGDFGGNLLVGQFHKEILSDNLITKTLNHVTIRGNAVKVVFSLALSAAEETELNALITAHVPAAAVPLVIANSLNSATTTIDMSAATAPTSGQVLTALGSDLANWQNPKLFGTSYQYIESEGESISTLNTFETKTSITTGTLVSGIYRIYYSCEMKTNSRSEINIEIDYNDTVCGSFTTDSDKFYISSAGYRDVNLSGVNVIRIRYNSSSSNKSVYIRRARLSIIRLS